MTRNSKVDTANVLTWMPEMPGAGDTIGTVIRPGVYHEKITTWSPTVAEYPADSIASPSSTPPSDPTEGLLWFCTNPTWLKLFVYHSGVWMSTDSVSYGFSYNNVANNVYFDNMHNPSNVSPIILPHSAVLTSIDAKSESTVSWTLQIYKNGILNLSYVVNSGKFISNNMLTNFSASDEISVRCSGYASKPSVVLMFAWRHS